MNQMALQVLEVSKISFVWSEKEKEIKNKKYEALFGGVSMLLLV